MPLQGVVLDAPALSASSDQVRILHRVSGAEAPKEVQQAVIAATVEFFTQSSGRKGYVNNLAAVTPSDASVFVSLSGKCTAHLLFRYTFG